MNGSESFEIVLIYLLFLILLEKNVTNILEFGFRFEYNIFKTMSYFLCKEQIVRCPKMVIVNLLV